MESADKPEIKFLPYGHQGITQEDIDAVVEVLKSDWLTQGPMVAAFEEALARKLGTAHAVACSSGTAALHLAMLALGIGPGDKVATSANTFLADANCARYVGADVVFADVDPDTGILAVPSLERLLAADVERRIKVIIPVHFAGQPAALPRIHELAQAHGATLVDDACHALGASYEHDGAWHVVGSGAHAAMTVFSFHPVKHVTSGEGGAVATSDDRLANRLRLFRNHGMIRQDFEIPAMALAPDGSANPWYYEMPALGYNYRLTDIQSALGYSQLRRLDGSVHRRNEIARLYHRLIAEHFEPGLVRPLETAPGVVHAYHLFVVRIDFARLRIPRAAVMTRLRRAGIGTQVHYIPVPLQPYYRSYGGTKPGDFPGAEAYYAQALSLPMYPDLTDGDCIRVIEELALVLTAGTHSG